MSITLRAATPEEYRLVRDSWSRSFAPDEFTGWNGDGVIMFRGRPRWEEGKGLRAKQLPFRNLSIAPRVWHRAHRLAVGEILDTAMVLVATHAKVPNEALAWIAFERMAMGVRIHYVFTKRRARRRGIGLLLVRAAVEGAENIRLSHETPEGLALVRKALCADEQKDRQPVVA